MIKFRHIGLITTLLLITAGSTAQKVIDYKGQLSLYSHYNGNNEYPLWSGARYIPQANITFPVGENQSIDFELSANLYGNAGTSDFSYVVTKGDIKPYRMWARYSTPQFEIRAGLQKINFGSASLLRPLMWFDRIDPRDPLQLTDGVWGFLGRYYFLNNINLWFWTLYGNRDTKGWEVLKTTHNIPEIGGRAQFPVATGETALSYHYRIADFYPGNHSATPAEKIPEHRIGFDTRFDRVIGWWIEASWMYLTESAGQYTNQTVFNIGADYTVNLGNGVTIIAEQLIAAADEMAFQFNDPLFFSLLSASYPIGIFDNLSLISYVDWNNQTIYNFVDWQRQFNRLTLHFMGYINPTDYYIPAITGTESLFAGSGIQIMLVFNH